MTPDMATVDTMLASAGLDPSPAERETILATYAGLLPGLDALYAMPEARYEAPALVFEASPSLKEW